MSDYGLLWVTRRLPGDAAEEGLPRGRFGERENSGTAILD
jgi:hypothetical protein